MINVGPQFAESGVKNHKTGEKNNYLKTTNVHVMDSGWQDTNTCKLEADFVVNINE